MSKVRIGDLVDHDVSQYSFSRNSKLPRGTFDPDPLLPDIFAVVVSVGGFLLALFCGWGGQ